LQFKSDYHIKKIKTCSLKYYNTFDNEPCNRGSVAAEIRKIAEKLKVQIEQNRSQVKQVQDSLVQHHLFPG
jgi:type III secretion system FlhB-like substrate exporter